MSMYPNPYGGGSAGARPGETLGYESRADTATVAQFFNTVYAWMASGLALTAVVAWWVSTQREVMNAIFRGPTFFILLIAEIGLVIVISAGMRRISATVATPLFMIHSALNGLTLSIILVRFTGASLASTFIVTAGTFAAMSIYGFVTKRDLTALGSIL